MKKTLNINLSGMVFNIDEDAYEVLREYLRKLETQFATDADKEVMQDIEARLAELFSNSLTSSNKNVVTIDDVNVAIAQLGTAEEIGGESKDSDFDRKESNKENRKRHRKFYRDADNKILGGVAAGLAAYLGLEVTITRLILFLLAITVLGSLIPIYFIVWLIAPEATTTAQKLEMQGIEPSVENIKNYVNSEQFRESASRIGSRLGEVMKWLFRLAAICIGLFFGFIGIIVIFALLAALISILVGSGMIFGGLFALPMSNNTFIVFAISTLVAILIPIISIIMATIRLIRKENKPRKSGWGWMWFIVWLIASVMSVSTLLFSIPNIVSTLNNLDENNFVALFDSNIVTEERLRGENFDAIDIDEALAVQLVEDTCCYVEVRGNTTILRNIETRIEDNTLKIERISPIIDNLYNKSGVIIHYCNELRKIEMGSACVVSSESNRIKAADLEIDASSAAVINLGVDCEKLDIEASSAAVLNIWGNAGHLTSELSSATVVNFSDLTVDSATIKAASGAVIDLPKGDNIDINKEPEVVIK